MAEGHASGFRAAELGEDGADSDILDEGGIKVGVLGESGFEDLGMRV